MTTELLPTITGKTQGVVAVHEGKGDNYGYALQCQRCHDIEVPKYLVLMSFKFPPCTQKGNETSTRERLCPACHAKTCDRVRSSCRSMLTGRYY